MVGIHHIWWLQVSKESHWVPQKTLQRRGSRLGSRRMGKTLSIKCMINSRGIRKTLRQGRSWRWRSGKFMSKSTSVSSSWSYLQLYKTFLTMSVDIPLFLSAFILIIVCILLTGSRRLRRLFTREIQHIFGTTMGYSYYIIPSVWENFTLIIQRKLISIIGHFYFWILRGKSSWTNKNVCTSFIFCPWQNS